MKWANTRLSLAPVTGGRAGLEAEGKAITEELEETSRVVTPEERAKLVTAADAAVVVVYPPGTPIEVSTMLPLAAVEAVEEAMKPETGSTALGLIDAIVGTADAALLPPKYQLCSFIHGVEGLTSGSISTSNLRSRCTID